jgi:hypothetical protein
MAVVKDKKQCEFESHYDSEKGEMAICGKDAAWRFKGKNLCEAHADYALAVYGIPKEIQSQKMRKL